MLGVKAKSIVVNYDDKDTYIQNIIIGIYPGRLSKTGSYKALIGLELLEYKGGVDFEDESIRTIKV